MSVNNTENIMGFSLEAIERLAKLVKENELEELKITDDGITVKGKKCPPPPPPALGNFGAPFYGTVKNDPAVKEEYADTSKMNVEKEASGNKVKSPIVGTYYGAPAPGKAPFVTVGQSVKKGDVIMIIESMKLMNEVQSEFDGVVKKILVKDGEPVEYDQTIMIIG